MGRNIRKFIPGLVELDVGALIALIPGGQGIGLLLMQAGMATTAQGATHPMRILSAPAPVANAGGAPRTQADPSAGFDRCA